MEDYIKQELDRILKSELKIYWWFMGRKKLDFDGTVDGWFEENKVFPLIKKDKYEISYDLGSMEVKMFHRDFETLVRMVISLHLSYLGGKSEFTLLGRTKTFNK